MYIQAEVEMIPEIDENISFEKWEALVELWKKKIIKQALPQIVDSHSLDHVLEQYYLNTDTPTIDYIYSLSVEMPMYFESDQEGQITITAIEDETKENVKQKKM